MAYRKIGTRWDENMREDIDTMFKELFDEYIGAGNDASEAKEKAGQALADSLLAKETADVTREEMLAIIREQTEGGDLVPEITQARGGHEVLGDRLNSINQELAQTGTSNDNRAFYEGIKLNRKHKAIMSIVDDDGYPEVYQLLKPVVEQEGVPITTAIITGRVDVEPYSMTLQQIKECEKAGMEIQSHTHSHRPLATLTYEEQEYEIKTAKEWLQRNGFSSEALIYPYGSTNIDTYEITKRYHSAGVYIDGGSSQLNNTPIRSERLQRVYYNLTEPVTETDKNRIQHCKNKIDEAIANDSWMILGLHCFYDGFDPEGLREVIQYAKTQGIDIVTVKRGLELYSNIIELPDFTVDATGKLHSYSLGRFVDMTSAIDGNTPITAYPANATSRRTFGAKTPNMPLTGRGFVITHRFLNDDFSTQLIFSETENKAWIRGWQNGEWTTPTPMAQEHRYVDMTRTVTGSTPVTSFPANATSRRTLSAGTAGIPADGRSTIETHRFLNDSFSFQLLHSATDGRIWMRNWNGTSWNEFIQIGGGYGHTSNRPTSPPLGYSYFDSVLGKPIWHSASGWVDATGASV